MTLKLVALILASFVTVTYANPVPHAVSEAAIQPREFSGEMLNQDITQSNIQDTICRKRFTNTIRPPISYMNGVKFKLLREAGIPEENAGLYELDHIVPLSVGGHPRKLANLMLQPYENIEDKPGARQKDRLELKLQSMVCNEEIDLATAQREIGGDWLTAYGKYIKHKRKH